MICITPGPQRFGDQLVELWEYRRLFWFLAWRDVKVRYKQTVVGVAWALVQPLATMGIFALVFGRLAHLPSAGKPYAVFALAALVPWGFFSSGLAAVSNSLAANGPLLRRAYFPRLVIPVSSLGVTLVDFSVALVALLAVAWASGQAPSTRLVLILPAFAVLAIFTLGLGVAFAILNAMYRDVRHFIPFVTQLALFATPVVYSSEIVPERWRWLLALNPLAPVMEGFRAAVLGTPMPLATAWGWTALGAGLVLALGTLLFRRLELVLADVV